MIAFKLDPNDQEGIELIAASIETVRVMSARYAKQPLPGDPSDIEDAETIPETENDEAPEGDE